jgi:transglutaminase-like putative cysteine protease
LRNIFQALFALAALLWASPLPAASPAKPPPLEIVKLHVDVQVMPNGTYDEAREIAYRLLTEASVQALRETTLSYTEGYQELNIMKAYTLKPNGTHIDVGSNGMLKGYGASTSPGFQDLKTIHVIFPNVEVGDEIVLITASRQIKPWFDGQFASEYMFPAIIATHDGSISITAPDSLPLQFDNLGLDAGAATNSGSGMTRRTWRYSNDRPSNEESGVVSPIDTGPRLVVSTFPGYGQVADVYRRLMHGKTDVTPEIKQQADKIVAGIADRRQQARAIYNWVATHIGYVNIVLGAGGFVPHDAPAILNTHYGDCKDHVVLLSSLLAAEGIASAPVLIEGTNQFQLPKAASPFVFNHIINYLPEFNLFADSTARHAPFGQIPPGDTGKPALNIMTGEIVHTPVRSANDSQLNGVETVTIDRSGSADGETKVTATGASAMATRVIYQLVNSSNEAEFFRRLLGAGASGSFDAENVDVLADPFTYQVHFHVPNAANMPGPAAISSEIGFQPFYPIATLGGDLPAARTLPYTCASLAGENDLTISFPTGTKFLSIPGSTSLSTEGVSLTLQYQRVGPSSLHVLTRLRADHPSETCDPAYYARVRPKLAAMIAALRGQILYQVKETK